MAISNQISDLDLIEDSFLEGKNNMKCLEMIEHFLLEIKNNHLSLSFKKLTTEDLFSGEGMAAPGSDRALAEYVGQETLGTLKLFLIHVEEEIDKIKSMSTEFPVYSAYMAEELREMFRSKNVSIEHFKRMPSTTDIKWAKSVIDSVESLFDELYNNLG